jgi:hypothetical protein
MTTVYCSKTFPRESAVNNVSRVTPSPEAQEPLSFVSQQQQQQQEESPIQYQIAVFTSNGYHRLVEFKPPASSPTTDNHTFRAFMRFVGQLCDLPTSAIDNQQVRINYMHTVGSVIISSDCDMPAFLDYVERENAKGCRVKVSASVSRVQASGSTMGVAVPHHPIPDVSTTTTGIPIPANVPTDETHTRVPATLQAKNPEVDDTKQTLLELRKEYEVHRMACSKLTTRITELRQSQEQRQQRQKEGGAGFSSCTWISRRSGFFSLVLPMVLLLLLMQPSSVFMVIFCTLIWSLLVPAKVLVNLNQLMGFNNGPVVAQKPSKDELTEGKAAAKEDF